MPRKALEMELFSPYRGFMRGTWREGCYTWNSQRHVMECCGKGVFF